MQSEYFNRSQPKYNTFSRCHQKIRRLMKSNKALTIIICQQENRYYRHDITICPIRRVDINQLVLSSIDNPVQIRQFSLTNQSYEQFFLGSIVLEKISQKYSNLKKIFLRKCNIGDRGIELLRKIKLECLQNFDLGGNKLTKQAMKVLAVCRIKRLSLLHVNNNRIGNVGLSFLAKTDWPQLNFLNVSECDLSMDAARLISKAHWPKLQSLYLQGQINQLLYIKSVKNLAKEFYPRIFKDDHFYEYLRWETADLLINNKRLKSSYKRYKNKGEQNQQESNEDDIEEEEDEFEAYDNEYEDDLTLTYEKEYEQYFR